MSKPSTLHLRALPEIETLKRLCKSISALDAIICPEWEYRYYSYNKAWDAAAGEECMQMRDGSGDEFMVLFSKDGAVINGLAHESVMVGWQEVAVPSKNFLQKVFGKRKTERKQVIWNGVVDTLPEVFKHFIFGEPVASIGTTFCIWRQYTDVAWRMGRIKFPDDAYGDGSKDLLFIFDNKPTTYRSWAIDYYEDEFDGDPEKLDLELVKHVYEHRKLTKDVVLKINPQLDDWGKLKADLDEIGYAYGF